MSQYVRATPAASAILTMADVQAAADGFNDGETNVFEALDAIIVAVDACQAAARSRGQAA